MEFSSKVFNRERIIDAIDMLLDRSDSIKQANARAYFQNLQQDYAEKSVFSIDSLVFDRFISLLNDPAVLVEDAWIKKIRKQLLGQLPSPTTIVIKHNFLESLQSDKLQVIDYLREFCRLYTNLIKKTKPKSIKMALPEEYDHIRHYIHELNYSEQWTIDSISTYLILQAVHTLLTLPYVPAYSFSIMDNTSRLSYIYEVDETMFTADVISYVQDLLQKLEGIQSIFVDVHMLSDGVIVNVR